MRLLLDANLPTADEHLRRGAIVSLTPNRLAVRQPRFAERADGEAASAT